METFESYSYQDETMRKAVDILADVADGFYQKVWFAWLAFRTAMLCILRPWYSVNNWEYGCENVNSAQRLPQLALETLGLHRQTPEGGCWVQDEQFSEVAYLNSFGIGSYFTPRDCFIWPSTWIGSIKFLTSILKYRIRLLRRNSLELKTYNIYREICPVALKRINFTINLWLAYHSQ
jgi:hypothetical protein